MNKEKPKINFVLKLFRLQNWRKLRPADETKQNRTQYIAATIGRGIEAKKAPNFPNTEKTIMKAADICVTLRLPTFVNANKPAFSTEAVVPVRPPSMPLSKTPIPSHPVPRLITEGGAGVALPYLPATIKVPVDSKIDTKEAAIIAKASPALKVGLPH